MKSSIGFLGFLSFFLVLSSDLVLAQNCYGPNGNVSTTDAACSDAGVACCPLNWDCLNNGLCYLDNEGYYGRYTCTDQTWQSDDCPQVCTHANTIAGNEAVLQCPDGSWCCDGDRSFDCCDQDDTQFFSLFDGTSTASISTLRPVTNVPPLATPNSPYIGALPSTESESSRSPSTSSDPSTTAGSASGSSAKSSSTSSIETGSSSHSPMKSTLLTETTISGTNGIIGTATVTLISTVDSSTASETISPSGGASRSVNLPAIIGPSVAVPLALGILFLLGFCLHKRRQKRKPARLDVRLDHPADAYAPEIDSFPVASGRTNSKRISELSGSNGFSTQRSPQTPSTGSLSTYGNGAGRFHLSPASGPYSPRSELRSVNEEPAELAAGEHPLVRHREVGDGLAIGGLHEKDANDDK